MLQNAYLVPRAGGIAISAVEKNQLQDLCLIPCDEPLAPCSVDAPTRSVAYTQEGPVFNWLTTRLSRQMHYRPIDGRNTVKVQGLRDSDAAIVTTTDSEDSAIHSELAELSN